MDMKFCKRFSKFKMLDSKARPWAAQSCEIFVKTISSYPLKELSDFDKY